MRSKASSEEEYLAELPEERWKAILECGMFHSV